MPGFIKKTFIVLVLVLLGFDGSLATNCVSMNNKPCIFRPFNVITVHLLLVYPGAMEVVILLKVHLVKYVFLKEQKM